MQRREKETRERGRRGGVVVGPGVANHHMSAHGVPGPPPNGWNGWMDGLADETEEREKHTVRGMFGFYSGFYAHVF